MTLPIARELARSLIAWSRSRRYLRDPMMAGLPQEAQDSLGRQVPHTRPAGPPCRVRDPGRAHRGQCHAQRRGPSVWTAPSGWDRSDARCRHPARSTRHAGLPAADFFDFESLLSAAEQAKLAELGSFWPARWHRSQPSGGTTPSSPPTSCPSWPRWSSAPRPSAATANSLPAGHRRDDRVDTSLATFFLVHHDCSWNRCTALGSKSKRPACCRTRRTCGPRGLCADRTGPRLRRRRRHGNHRPPRGRRASRRLLGAQRRQALDRQRDVLRLHAGLGPGTRPTAASAASSSTPRCRA